MRDPTSARDHRRTSRTLLLAFLFLAVLATIPWLAPDLQWVRGAPWFGAAAGLTAASASGRFERWLIRLGPVVFLTMVLWLVLITGGPTSPYGVLYIPLVGFIAVFRETRVFLSILVLATLAWMLPAALEGSGVAVAGDLLAAAVVAGTSYVIHRAAATYRDTNRLYLTVLEHHAGPTYMITPEAEMSWANEPLQRVLGLPMDGIVGVPWPEFVAEGETERLMPAFLAALDGEPQRITVETDAPGGRYQLRGTIFPMYSSGRVTGVMGITEDVTELHAAAFGAEALRQTLDVLAFPVAIFDAETSATLYANHAAWWLTGCEEQQEAELAWSDLHPTLQRDRPPPGASHTETIVVTTGGTDVELDVTIQGLGGRRPILALIGLDASERARRERTLEQLAAAEREAAERLRSLDRMKNAFLSAVSHELRTPLTMILGGALSLQRLRDHTDVQTRSQIEDAMVNQAEDLTMLLEDLLDVDRLTRSTTHTSHSSFDVVALVRRQLATLATDPPPTLDAPDRLVALADETQIERIVANLLENADKYAPSSPVAVTIRELDAGGFRIEVADEGPGIPPEDRERVFEPFHRLDFDHPQPGTGIGLALVAEFAAMHGGGAWVEPGVEAGTRVIVEIPETLAAATHAER